MKLGMCIVNYNDYKTTKRLIDNIINYKCLDKIVVVDNKSTDNSLINLKKLESKKIKIIASNKNGGYSYALNIGCKYLIEEFKELTIIVSNSDIIIDSENDLIDARFFNSKMAALINFSVVCTILHPHTGNL